MTKSVAFDEKHAEIWRNYLAVVYPIAGVFFVYLGIVVFPYLQMPDYRWMWSLSLSAFNWGGTVP